MAELFTCYKKATNHRVFFNTIEELNQWFVAMNIESLVGSNHQRTQLRDGTWELWFITESIQLG
jgi:hypothetical protein